MSPICLQPQYETVCLTKEKTSGAHGSVREEMQVDHDSRNLYYANEDQSFGGFEHFATRDWDKIIEEIIQDNETIWDTPKMQKLLSEPLGSPVDLTEEEAMEVISLAFGRRPDLLAGDTFVREVRQLLGHSIIERLGKTEEKGIKDA